MPGLTGALAEREPSDVAETCATLTTRTSEDVTRLRDRAPAILPPVMLGSSFVGDEVPNYSLSPTRGGGNEV